MATASSLTPSSPPPEHHRAGEQKEMVNTSQREDQDASVIAPSERGPQPQEETFGNQEANSRLSVMAEVQQMFRDMADRNQQMFRDMADQHQQMFRDMAERICKMMEAKMGSIRSPGCSYATFFSCQPPEFSGSRDPTAILNWITEMELTFHRCGCGEEQKVEFAVCMLKWNALSWWNMTRVLLGNEIVSHFSWNDFVGRIKKHYCSARDYSKMENEFLTLKKGSMTVDEYVCLFVEKLQYVGHLAPHDKDRVDHFVAGLPSEYLMAAKMAKSFDMAIRAAKRVEENENKERKDVEKRKWEGTSGSLKKSRGEAIYCYHCGKVGHVARECPNKMVVCFECGENGHISAYCPKKERD